MTASLSWLAIRGSDEAKVRAQLSLRTEGEQNDTTAAHSIAALPGGWMLVLAQQVSFADGASHETLSSGGDLITCTIDERLMYSSASGWRDGKRLWYIVHDGQIGMQHIHVEGELPAEFHPLFNRLSVNQAEAGGLNITVDHVFDVPIELAKRLTGFRHDEPQ